MVTALPLSTKRPFPAWRQRVGVPVPWLRIASPNMNTLRALCLSLLVASPLSAADSGIAASAINALGLDLHRRTPASAGNTCISPYAIQIGLAMTSAGTRGATHSEMARALHYPAADATLQASLGALADQLSARQDGRGDSSDLFVLTVFNRLWVQQGFAMREPFVALLRDRYQASPEPLDFAGAAGQAPAQINRAVGTQLRGRFRDLVAPTMIDARTRLVLTSACYLRAAWSNAFDRADTTPQRFVRADSTRLEVPMLTQQRRFGYRRFRGYHAVALPYFNCGLQLLVVVPESATGLPAAEAALTPDVLRTCTRLPLEEIEIHLPKIRLAPPTLQLADALVGLGMASAFDRPPGSADFDPLAPRRADDYLRLADVLHRTSLAFDENGTEADAATIVKTVPPGRGARLDTPTVVRIDRPFFYAVQDVTSGACLLMGRVVDPR